MTLTLKPETEALLRAKAEREGKDVNQIADVLLAHVLQEEPQSSAEAPPMAGDDIQETATALADAAREADPDLQRILLFPAQDEVRLLYVDATARPTLEDEAIAPFYFGPDRRSGLQYPSAIALIRPEEEGKRHLPSGWGTWEDAVAI